MSETQPGSFDDLRPPDRAEQGREAGAIGAPSAANGPAAGRRFGRHRLFRCGSPSCGCRKRRAPLARPRRSDAWSRTWEARIYQALRRRPATQPQLVERLARTRLLAFGDRPLDPTFLAAIDHMLRVTGEIRWRPLKGRQRVRRLEVAR